MTEKADRRSLRVFGIGAGVIFGAVSLLLFCNGFLIAACFVGGVAALLLIPGLLCPGALGPIYGPWSRAARAIGLFQTKVILSAVYFLVFTPFSLLARLFGKDLLDMKEARGAETHWKKRPASRTPDYRRQF